MTQARLDGQPLARFQETPTWGEVLALVDGTMGGDDRLVMAVRFDGVDQPEFRSPDLLARPLHDTHMVEVETATPAALARLAIAEAAGGLACLADAAATVAASFRKDNPETALEGLRRLVTSLDTALRLLAAVGLVLRVDLDRFAAGGRPLTELAARMTDLVQQLADAQARSDWIEMADLLEYDLRAALDAWCGVCDALDQVA